MLVLPLLVGVLRKKWAFKVITAGAWDSSAFTCSPKLEVPVLNYLRIISTIFSSFFLVHVDFLAVANMFWLPPPCLPYTCHCSYVSCGMCASFKESMTQSKPCQDLGFKGPVHKYVTKSLTLLLWLTEYLEPWGIIKLIHRFFILNNLFCSYCVSLCTPTVSGCNTSAVNTNLRPVTVGQM